MIKLIICIYGIILILLGEDMSTEFMDINDLEGTFTEYMEANELDNIPVNLSDIEGGDIPLSDEGLDKVEPNVAMGTGQGGSGKPDKDVVDLEIDTNTDSASGDEIKPETDPTTTNPPTIANDTGISDTMPSRGTKRARESDSDTDYERDVNIKKSKDDAEYHDSDVSMLDESDDDHTFLVEAELAKKDLIDELDQATSIEDRERIQAEIDSLSEIIDNIKNND